MMGLVGWSVAIPTLLGAALGIWLDQHYPGKHAWTLALLVVGLAVGCFNAWHWVARKTKRCEMSRRMAMNEVLAAGAGMVAGVLLGAIFFGGLWWTVRKGLSSEWPALWFFGSLLLRMGIVLAGFYLSDGGHWARLLLCLVGFVIARLMVTRLTRPPEITQASRCRRPAMRLSPDQMIFWQHGFLKLNGTIVFTWALMLVLAVGSKLVTRRLSTDLKRSRWQNLLEIVVTGIEKQIEEVGLRHPEKYIGFLGTLFLFVALASLCTIIPGFEPPTGSLSTTAALALCVLVAVPMFGIEEQGLGGYLKSYAEPTVIMLPFNIISELSRTLALAVRLFGNMMSGAMIIAILLTITPFIFPIVMTRARPAHRHGAGLHLQHSGRGLHRGRHARAQAQA